MRPPLSQACQFLSCLAVLLQPALLWGAPFQNADAASRPFGFMAWYKILLIVVVYVPWVILANQANIRMLRFGRELKMPPELWNPIIVGSFLLGFALVLFVPIFWVGWPLFLVFALLPPIVHMTMFRSGVKQSDVVKYELNPNSVAITKKLVQDQGVEMTFQAAGKTAEVRSLALIRARQLPEFVTLKNLLANILLKRADALMLDARRENVDVRILVDGAWHALQPVERSLGDAFVMALKYLAGANPEDRRSRQGGTFRLNYPLLDIKTGVQFSSQGVPTGERVQIRFMRATARVLKGEEIGLSPERLSEVTAHFNRPGLIVVSAAPGEGLTTSWRALLGNTDRFTRDCVAIISENESETDLENIVPKVFTKNDGPREVLRKALLTQPQMLVVPDMVDAATADLLADEVNDNERTVITRTHASSASEALLRTYAKSKDRAAFANAMTFVTCQRLIRRLCESCRTPAQINPELFKRLGGEPGKPPSVYRPFVPPPPEQNLDEKGNPIEIPPCSECQGLGYSGRTIVLESIAVNDAIRDALRKDPKLANITQVVRNEGNKDLLTQAYRLVLDGTTSLEEVKRVFQAEKK